MNHFRHSCVLVTLSVAFSGCSAPDETAPAEGTVGASQDTFSTAPGEPNHEEITGTALSFLRPELVFALQEANAATDVEFLLVNANHFDDCNFSGGADVVRTSQAEAVAALDPAAATPETDLLAIVAFARSLHAVQDFYAHTNWIELGGNTLLDTSSDPFPSLTPYSTVPSSGFVLVQGRKPKRAALTRDDDAPYPRDAIVNFRLGGTHAFGLISGTVDYEPGNYCPDSVAMTHTELNKDKSTLVGRLQQFEAARSLAILQTEHEWCRLRALTGAAWGDSGVAHLDSWVATGAVQPACD